ncbi:MAG: ParB N-terminal domain-containing protein [Oscillospiraceae bacterium]|nr:ParB N-terminal domain-containing protein [Oscillospiraceae bacterium]MBR4548570.1 ParB N-terminal domain-containing protein [Oscillospiraceae bacterium]
MAETMGFDLAAALKGVPDLNTGEEQIVRLPLDAIDPDPVNFYSLEGPDELAENIETVGLLDPIRVRPNGERYTVVSGHRRRAACLLIRDGGNPMFDSGVPCIVEYGEASDAMRRLRLIYANSCTRERSDAEKRREIEETRKALYELQAQGVQFTGRMRDHVAEAVNLTKSKIGRLDAIGHRCHEYILDAFDQGKINESVAYAFSRLDKALQKKIWVNHLHLGYKPEALTAEYVEKLGDLHRKLCTIKCKKSSVGCPCTYAESRFDYAQKLTHFEGVRENCYRGRCCLGCQEIGTCEWACIKCEAERAQAITEADRLKQQRQTDLEMRQAAAERARREHDEESAAIWARIGRAAAETGRNLEGVLDQLWESDGDVQQILRFVSGEEKDVQHYAIEFLDDCLIDLADLLGCSTDFLLGRTEAVKPAACHSEPVTDVTGVGIRIPDDEEGERIATSPSAPRNDSGEEAAAPEARWLTGTPEKEGWYACLGVWADMPERTINYWRGAWYEEKNSRRVLKDVIITKFFPLPDMEE